MTQFDLRNPENAERLAAASPDAYLRRRDFLSRMAVMGAAAGATLALPDQLLVRAAAQASASPLPSGDAIPIDHIVVLMQENRSFDHYLGWREDADGIQAGLSYPDPEAGGTLRPTHRLTDTSPEQPTPDYQGCGHPDPDHSWEGGRAQVNGGAMDGFLAGENDEFALGYYAEPDLPFLPAAAKAFTTCDHYFCSLLGPTIPNRSYQWAATSAGIKDNTEMIESAAAQGGFPWPNIFDRMREAGLEARYFASDIPASLLWGPRMLPHTARVEEFYARCATGTLPHLSFVDPLFGASFAGEPDGVAADEHPHGDVRTGQAFVSDVVHAFLESPNYRRGALFVNYDEWGGFFDHVAPPKLAPSADEHSAEDFNQLGVRVPALAISPWTARGKVSHFPFDHTSILALVERRFGLVPLGLRDGAVESDPAQIGPADHANIGLAFEFDKRPKYEVPDLPDPAAVLSKPCATSPTTDGVDVPPEAPHAELRSLVTSGYLERIGYEYEPPELGDVFREPDTVRKAILGT